MLSCLEIGKRSLEREANAHLIAASPDLLEALEDFFELFVTERNETLLEVIAAKKAVAKAYGETP